MPKFAQSNLPNGEPDGVLDRGVNVELKGTPLSLL